MALRKCDRSVHLAAGRRGIIVVVCVRKKSGSVSRTTSSCRYRCGTAPAPQRLLRAGWRGAGRESARALRPRAKYCDERPRATERSTPPHPLISRSLFDRRWRIPARHLLPVDQQHDVVHAQLELVHHEGGQLIAAAALDLDRVGLAGLALFESGAASEALAKELGGACRVVVKVLDALRRRRGQLGGGWWVAKRWEASSRGQRQS